MAAAEPIRDKRELKQFALHYLKLGKFRNYSLIVMGVHTALRISDLLLLKWEDVYDFNKKQFRMHLRLKEKKTGKQKIIAINKDLLAALKLYFPRRRGIFIFANNRRNAAPISRVQAYRIIKTAAGVLKKGMSISCHSLRKTFGYHAWKSGVAVAVIMDIYNHSSYEITRRYLGISQDDRDKVYLKMALI